MWADGSRRYKDTTTLHPFIIYGVWLPHRFSLGLRKVEDLLAEHGVDVSYRAIRRWRGTFEHAFNLRNLVQPYRAPPAGRPADIWGVHQPLSTVRGEVTISGGLS